MQGVLAILAGFFLLYKGVEKPKILFVLNASVKIKRSTMA